MRPPETRLLFDDELIVDNFAGGGGASVGIEQGCGRRVDIAINHDPEALAMHRVNHPETEHLCEDVWDVDIKSKIGNRKVGVAWFSPDCKHHSKAKGGKPVEKKLRGLAWVALRWAGLVKPRIIFLENVEEFQFWGMVHRQPRNRRDRERCRLCKQVFDGRPCPQHKGVTFKRWITQLRNLGYDVEWREMRACGYGAPTIRKRLFIVARCDGQPIVWPETTHGKGKMPYRTAAEIIDWSLPCPSIFTDKQDARKLGIIRPLADKTLRRIARGVMRYVIEAKTPFIVNLTHHGSDRNESIDQPMNTITAAHRGEKALIVPSLVRTAHGERDKSGKKRGRGEHPLTEPLPTTCASQDLAIVTPFLQHVQHSTAPNGTMPLDEPMRTITATPDGGGIAMVVPTLVQTGYGERDGQAPRVPGLDKPLGTVVSGGKHALVSAMITPYYGTKSGGNERGVPLDRPLPTQPTENRHALVSAVLVGAGGPSYSGKPRDIQAPTHTQTTENHAALVTAFLAQHNGGVVGHPADKPLSTITQRGTQQQLVTSSIVKLRGTSRDGQPVDQPLATISAQGTHLAEVRAFLIKYFGTDQDPRLEEPLHTVTVKDRFGLVTVHGEQYEIVDIGMRMLSPRELFNAQGFPSDYIIDRGVRIQDYGDAGDLFATDIALTKTAQIRMCGNSVSPHPAAALVRANCERMPAQAVA